MSPTELMFWMKLVLKIQLSEWNNYGLLTPKIIDPESHVPCTNLVLREDEEEIWTLFDMVSFLSFKKWRQDKETYHPPEQQLILRHCRWIIVLCWIHVHFHCWCHFSSFTGCNLLPPHSVNTFTLRCQSVTLPKQIMIHTLIKLLGKFNSQWKL